MSMSNSKRNGACRITFQPSSTSTYPTNHLFDSGKNFTPQKGFGWASGQDTFLDKEHQCSRHFRDRRASERHRKQCTNTNDIDACLVHFQPEAVWTINLGAGEWVVTIRCGDPSYPSVVSLDVNHKEHRLMGLKLKANEFYNWTFTTTPGTPVIVLTTTVAPGEHKRNWTRVVSFQAIQQTKSKSLRQLSNKGATLFKNSLRTATSVAQAPRGTGLVQRDWVRAVRVEEKQAKWRTRVLRLKYGWKRASTKARNTATLHNLTLDRDEGSSKTSFSNSASSTKPSEPPADQAKVKEVMAMGIARNHAIIALSKKYNSVAHAIDWYFNNMSSLPPASFETDASSSSSSSSSSTPPTTATTSKQTKTTTGYGTGLSSNNIGRRRATKQSSPIIDGRAESISRELYTPVLAKEGMKHHADCKSLIQILPNDLLSPGTMMIQTHSKEATQSTEERQRLDLGCSALSFRISRAAHIYVAVDRRLAEQESLPMWLLDDVFQPIDDQVIAVSHGDINYFVLFVQYVPHAGEVHLGPSGSLGFGGYLPYFVFVKDATA